MTQEECGDTDEAQKQRKWSKDCSRSFTMFKPESQTTDPLIECGWKKFKNGRYALRKEGILTATKDWAAYIQKLILQRTWAKL